MKCRHCQEELTLPFVDLGSAPPSNRFMRTADQPEKFYPLRVMVCTNCWLVQTDISQFTLDYDELFTEDYPYFSSTSPGFVAHAKAYVDQVTHRFGLGRDSLTVEIGSNDGYLLQHVKTPCYGIEPTATGAIAGQRGIKSYKEFFTAAVAKVALDWEGPADLIIANNVIAHVPDINDFMKGVALLLKPQGVASFEFPHLLNLVRFNQFDTIYHEHYSYLSLTALTSILLAQGLDVFDVERIPTHGGSLRVYVGRGLVRSVAVSRLLLEEELAGIRSPDFYAGFQAAANRVKDEFLSFLITAKRLGRTVAGFGAAAKGNTFLNYAGVHEDLLGYVVDETSAKQGRFLPGSRIRVLGAFAGKPDYVVILPWNFRREIMAKLHYVRDWGGKFVCAIPQLEIV